MMKQMFFENYTVKDIEEVFLKLSRKQFLPKNLKYERYSKEFLVGNN